MGIKFLFLRILARFWQICIEKLWHNQAEFPEHWEMGCCFGNSLDAFMRYGELVFLPK
jgi:hypothetical protein